MFMCCIVGESTKNHAGDASIRRAVTFVVNIVRLDTFSLLAKTEGVVKFLTVLCQGEIRLMFHPYDNVGIVAFPRRLYNVDLHLGLLLRPIFDTIPVF